LTPYQLLRKNDFALYFGANYTHPRNYALQFQQLGFGSTHALSSRMTTPDKRISRNRNQRDWREICEEVLKEKNSERVDDLLDELLDVLERRSLHGGGGHRIETSQETLPEPRFGEYFAKLGIV
jgi:hypothetical protein